MFTRQVWTQDLGAAAGAAAGGGVRGAAAVHGGQLPQPGHRLEQGGGGAQQRGQVHRHPLQSGGETDQNCTQGINSNKIFGEI